MNEVQSCEIEVPNFDLSADELESIKIAARESAKEDYFKELEAEHKKELASINWLEIFAEEAKKVIPKKIKELQVERQDQANLAKITQIESDSNIKNPFEDRSKFIAWFQNEIVIYQCATKIVEIDKHLARLRRELRVIKPPTTPKEISRQKALEKWEDDIKMAREYPLETLAESYLEKTRQFGSQIKALCPFHEEKTPSFVIYLNDNHFHCYGCGKHGDSIAFLMEKESVDFKEAVRRLVT